MAGRTKLWGEWVSSAGLAQVNLEALEREEAILPSVKMENWILQVCIIQTREMNYEWCKRRGMKSFKIERSFHVCQDLYTLTSQHGPRTRAEYPSPNKNVTPKRKLPFRQPGENPKWNCLELLPSSKQQRGEGNFRNQGLRALNAVEKQHSKRNRKPIEKNRMSFHARLGWRDRTASLPVMRAIWIHQQRLAGEQAAAAVSPYTGSSWRGRRGSSGWRNRQGKCKARQSRLAR